MSSYEATAEKIARAAGEVLREGKPATARALSSRGDAKRAFATWQASGSQLVEMRLSGWRRGRVSAVVRRRD